MALIDFPEELMAYWPNLRIGFTGAITFRDSERGRLAELQED